MSLIAPQWVLAAAHCLGKKSKINVKSCNVKGAAKCTRNDFGDFSLKLFKLPSHIRLGVSHFFEELADTKAHEISEIIRPRNAYPSGGYGVYFFNISNAF